MTKVNLSSCDDFTSCSESNKSISSDKSDTHDFEETSKESTIDRFTVHPVLTSKVWVKLFSQWISGYEDTEVTTCVRSNSRTHAHHSNQVSLRLNAHSRVFHKRKCFRTQPKLGTCSKIQVWNVTKMTTMPTLGEARLSPDSSPIDVISLAGSESHLQKQA